MSIDTDWLNHTYPSCAAEGADKAAREEGQELACLLRLEDLCWPEEPICPKCGEPSDEPWNDAPRGRGWRCGNRGCKARFHVLQVLPGAAQMHVEASVWFRAVYLLTNNGEMTVSALSRSLGVTRNGARSVRDRVAELKERDPIMIERIVAGPSRDAALLRRIRKRSR
jgi:hypothetical protein